jgi:hypothetical protein
LSVNEIDPVVVPTKDFAMQYKDLNPHFKERIRERVKEKLQKGNQPNESVDPTIRDFVVGVIILLADENNLMKAADRLSEIKQQNPATSGSYDDAILTVSEIASRFGTEVSILFDLYQMQENQEAIMDIIAQTEVRFLEPA